MYHVLYNPLSGNGRGYDKVLSLKELLKDGELQFTDIREVKNWQAFFDEISESDALVIAGGDGTLNCFVNAIGNIPTPKNIFYYATGSGNDFLHDVAPNEQGLIPLGKYITDLPIVEVKGKRSRFLNGIGYGIDGYCCEVGDELRRKSDKPVNYTAIAIKGLLFHYKHTRATVTVDGKEYRFEKVWLAPTMNGRYYGGGMMITPAQDRLNGNGQLSVAVFHGTGKLRTLMIFPSIFKGEHIRHEDVFTVLTGSRVHVAFDRPVALQIDGETVLNVSEYTVEAACVTDDHKKIALCGGTI